MEDEALQQVRGKDFSCPANDNQATLSPQLLKIAKDEAQNTKRDLIGALKQTKSALKRVDRLLEWIDVQLLKT